MPALGAPLACTGLLLLVGGSVAKAIRIPGTNVARGHPLRLKRGGGPLVGGRGNGVREVVRWVRR